MTIKVGAVGICQIHGIALALGQLLPDAEVRAFEAPVVRLHGKDLAVAEYLDTCDIVFSHSLNSESGELATLNLQKRIAKLQIVPIVIFSGYHPDAIYLGDGEHMFRSPVGMYHSTIVASAFSRGYSVEETELLFNKLVFGRLGFFQQYEASWGLMLADLTAQGYAPHLRLDRWSTEGPFMHSINHPKIRILAEIGRAAAIRAGLLAEDCPNVLPEYDWLACDTVWPIYPEIAEAFGFAGNYHFKRVSEITAAGLVPILRLPEFIHQSFEMYRAYPSTVFMSSEINSAQEVFRKIRGTAGRPDHRNISDKLANSTRRRRRVMGRARHHWDTDCHRREPLATQTTSTTALPIHPLPAARFIMRHLYRPVELDGGARFFAVAETEHVFGGDDWLWADDNAKVLEFVSRPDIWRHYPDEPLEMLRFVEAMCRGPFIFRRVAAPRLERVEGTGPVGRYEHSLMHVRTDLPNALVTAGVRFHDGRTADNLLLTGNNVEFTHKRRRVRINPKAALGDVAAEQIGDRLTIRLSGDLFFPWMWRQVRLGRMTYVYTIDARSMLIGVEATLEVDAHAAVSDVVLTIGHDQLSHGFNGVRYDTLAAKLPGGLARFAAAEPQRTIIPAAGAAYYEIAQAEIAGFALAVHTVPREPARLAEFEVRVEEPGKLHLARARYRFDGSCRGATLTIGEDKLLTSGGFYDRVNDYAELMQRALKAGAQPSVFDYSVSYDYGTEINAFAKCFAVASSEDLPIRVKDCAERARSLFDRYLAVYDECFVAGHRQQKNTIMSRQLAFVIMGLATMCRATGAPAYLEKLREMSEVLLDFEVRFTDIAGDPASAFPYGMQSERAAFVDGHSSSLSALAQARSLIDNPRFTEAIDRGIVSYCLETTGVGSPPHKVDVVSTSIVKDTYRHTENSYWNFNIGLALRFFNALRNSPVPELQATAAKYHDRIELFELVMRHQIERSIVQRGDAIEIRTSIHAGETNSETQPWVMLGLFGHPYD